MITVDQILLNAAPDELIVQSDELLPPSPSASSTNIQTLSKDKQEQINGDSSEDSHGFIVINKAKTFNTDQQQ